jgi:uncharacterized protein YraI
MMKTLVIAASLLTLATAANAAGHVCLVADPSGTPLNVRTQPNGTILGALHNDAEVVVVDLTRDRKWAKVVPIQVGKAGWVFFDYLDCSL